MGNNSVAVIMVGALGFLAIVIAGKWLLSEPDHHDCHVVQPPIITAQPPVSNHPPIIVRPQPTRPPARPPIAQPYPGSYPHYHNRNEFWQGYSDGWSGNIARQRCPEYLQGYQIGKYDRQCNRHQYYDQHCPPGFSLRIPGFNLQIH